MDPIETDYLVVGAGAAGMAFVDSLLSHTDAHITLVDKRAAPGGHWLDAYPFVRLHQPSAFYGVSSVPLGQGRVDKVGLNAGFHESASAAELCAYYERVMQDHFLPTGRVRFLPCTEHVRDADGRHRLRSRLSGAEHAVQVRRRWVDTGFLEGHVPATTEPPFERAPGVHCLSPDQLPGLRERPGRYVVIGGGKTALDTCVWLLQQGVAPTDIQWVRPRESWWLNRRLHQPGEGLPSFLEGVVAQWRAMAEAGSVTALFERLEAEGFFLRIDTAVQPTMCRGAIASEAEIALLRQITDVVRLGHVRRITPDRIECDAGSVPARADSVYVHCAAEGLVRPEPRPIFEADRITVQPVFWSFACFSFALLGAVEAMVPDTDEKNRLCPPIRYWDQPQDYLATYLALMRHEQRRAAHTGLSVWARDTRLNPLSGLGAHRDDPRVVQARGELKTLAVASVKGLQRLLG